MANPSDKFSKTGASNTTQQDANSKTSTIKTSLIIITTLLLLGSSLFYSYWKYSKEQNNLRESAIAKTSDEQFADVSDQAVNFVRKSSSKLSGITIEQALANYLNGIAGQEWEALGWKSSLEQGTTYTVKFIWKEKEERKEANWQVVVPSNKITAIDLVAKEVTPTIETTTDSNQQNSQPTK